LPPSAPLGLTALGGTDGRSRQQARQALIARLPQLAGTARALARLELARLLLAEGLGTEALVTLERIDEDGPPQSAAIATARAAMAGAAAALKGRHDTALGVLLDQRFDADAEAALWRVFAAALAGRSELAAQEWTRSGTMLDAYPEPLRRSLGPSLAAALVAQGSPEAALALAARACARAGSSPRRRPGCG
jgi:hypothetical protein